MCDKEKSSWPVENQPKIKKKKKKLGRAPNTAMTAGGASINRKIAEVVVCSLREKLSEWGGIVKQQEAKISS